MRALIWVVAVVHFASGCAEEQPGDVSSSVMQSPHPASQYASGPAIEPGSQPLPAYALPWETLKPGKADVIKDANPEYYAITQAPKLENWRHMREWEPMKAMAMTFTSWSSNQPELLTMYASMVQHTVPVAEAWIMYTSENAKTKLSDKLKEMDIDEANVKWFNVKHDSMWIIDYGPLPLINTDSNTVAFLDWKYYPKRQYDDAVSTVLGQQLGATVYRESLSFEGGNYQGDGYDNCYTTQRGLQESGWSAAQMAAGLKQYSNCQTLHFLKDITDDGTGHVDMFFKLFAQDGAVLGYYPDALADPENKKNMDDNEDYLKSIALPNNATMKVFRLPMPGYGKGSPFKTPFTYINSTLINGVNLWPYAPYDGWGASFDEAMAVWKEAMPNYEHIAIDSEFVSHMSGAIHCVTRTIPDLPFEKWVPDGTCADGECQPTDGFGDIAYDGFCIGETDPCFGPAWLEDVEPPVVVDPCGGYTFEGCCSGDALTFCKNDKIKTNICDPGTCGWSGKGNYYDCKTDGAEDPSGGFPRSCDEAVCTPACTDLQCGDDGCGGSCGTCAETELCSDGNCLPIPPPCEDECQLSQSGCGADENSAPWTCVKDSETGCTVKSAHDICPEGHSCTDGSCVEDVPPPATTSGNKDTSGCTAKRTGSPAPITLLLLVFLTLAARRRRTVK